MALREFFARHRIASAAAAPAALGVAAIVAASWGLMATPEHRDTRLTSSVTECHDMVTISVAGRNDSPDPNTTAMLVDANGNALPAALSSDYSSHWVDPVVNAPADDVDPGSYAAVYIAYPADMRTYEDAVNTGVTNTEKVMHDIAAACPDTKFSIVGYSEGADVARRVAMGVGHDEPDANGKYDVVDPKNVLGVVILADNGRTAGDGPFPGAKDPNHPDNFDTSYQDGNKPISGQGAMTDNAGDFGALDGKVASFCSEGDLTCAAPQNISLLQLAANVGRQLNVDDLQNEGLTPATGQDVAVTLGRIAMNAFSYIAARPDWMASDQTFLDVLLKVSEPSYDPAKDVAETPPADSISTGQLAPLAYLPQKVLNEIIGLIVTNQNTIPVVMSDPYQLTLGPNGTGHHFDYWRDSDAANGKPLTSAEYAAAWLTHLAKQAQAGETVDTKSKPTDADVQAAHQAVVESQAAPTTSAASSTTSAPTTTKAPATTQTSTTKAEPTTTTQSAPEPTTQQPTTSDPATSTPADPPRKEVAATVDKPVETNEPPVTTEPEATASTTARPTTTEPAPEPTTTPSAAK
ncbi:cutinase family protein [Nocardia vermiculata]|uniref:Cutinase family protein n=1 Tax=Nocardia vermiculata TaxID=257274 RepID=A0A846Y7C3_9NOCA|nr:cutinase family protein [Nocardia vermiculata]NKY53714.1 cutinase family protein [Nocardia vermiculata]